MQSVIEVEKEKGMSPSKNKGKMLRGLGTKEVNEETDSRRVGEEEYPPEACKKTVWGE